MVKTGRHASLALLLGLLISCASPVPRDIREPMPSAPGVGQVRSDPHAQLGARVRWGGSISNIENAAQETWIEVVSRPLGRDGEPEDGDVTEGRFLARIDGFLDPAIYAKDRKITVTGILQSGMQRKIGEFSYTFPVVHAMSHYLWPRRQAYRHAYPPPYYWSPYLWHPWYGYPWSYGPPYWW